MDKLKLNIKSAEHDLLFYSSSELLLSGMKLSYITPKKIEREIFNSLKKDGKYLKSIQNDCLEEGLMNSFSEPYEIQNESININSEWINEKQFKEL